MDANKLKVLQGVGYQIKPACGWCMYFTAAPSAPFGTCGASQYVHLKHSDAVRDLSVYRYGSCRVFTVKPEESHKQGAFDQFVELAP